MADTSDGQVPAPKPLGINEDHWVSRSLLTRVRLVVQRPVFRLIRGMTMGARTAVIDGEGRFLLVKATYAPGWIFPGGGVERGEACEDSARRELLEEAGIIAKGPLQLFGIFNNDAEMKGDHLAFYVLREFEAMAFRPNMEIADVRFFAADDLPERVNGGSRRRIAELVAGTTPSLIW
jgi:8-oxo-dGTP pyrophosphatase MutT (NUDIX family)